MLEKISVIDDIKIKYKFKPRKYDTRHLIIVFSGFGSNTEFTYDFENALQISSANILWIKDDFDNHCSYYICKNSKFNIEHAVLKLITHTLNNLKLSKSECTLVGFSKGGSAALYYGLKYDFQNILITVPQMHIADYIAKDWPETAKHMIGEDLLQTNHDALNSILPNLLNTDKNLNKNIYLLTSKADTQYKTDIEPHLGGFIKYSNMNLLISESVLVRAHNQVTSHHSQLLLGILFSLTSNAIPKFGFVTLKGDEPAQPIIDPALQTPHIELKNLKISDKLLFIEGIGVIKNVSCANWNDINYNLIFRSDNLNDIILGLAKNNRPSLTRDLYDSQLVNYDKGWFCTLRNKGLDISRIPAGVYQLFLHINAQGVEKEVTLKYAKEISLENNEKTVQIQANTTLVKLSIN
jgi:hypothetical protein